MKINIKATGAVMLTDEVRTFVEEKVDKLGKLLGDDDPTIMADIEIGTMTNSRTGDSYRAEINVTFTGGFARAEAERETLHAAIDEAVAEARREIRRARTRHRDLVRRGAAKVKDFFRYFRGN